LCSSSYSCQTNDFSPAQPGPSAKKQSKGKSRTIPASDIIDITNSDDDYDMGDRVFMQQQLQENPWQSYGLMTDLVTPALHPIKTMHVKDKALFVDDIQVNEIFRLGLKAFKDKQASHADSSNASDSSHKRSCGSDGISSTSKKLHRMEIHSESFTHSVRSKKGKGHWHLTPVFTDDDEYEDQDDVTGQSGDLVSYDADGDISWLFRL